MPVVEPGTLTPVARPPGPPDGVGVWCPPAPPRRSDDLGDRGDRLPEPERGRPLANARLGMAMLLGAESMFFGGLVTAFLMLRLSAPVWPPPLQPRLPVGLTAVNTVVLLLSSAALVRALRAARAGDQRGLVQRLAVTGGLGALFLAVQGVEWVRLVHFGLTVTGGAYGAAFYTLIGAHGVHVLGAVTWLAVVLAAARRGRYAQGDRVSLVTCAIYWHFVVALWPILYLLVYLA